jgi:nitroreductase
VHVDEAIRSRRTLKDYSDEPVEPGVVAELLDLAALAPNHHLTEPWRFWVVGRATLEALIEATGDRKLRRSATAIVVGVVRDDDPQVAEEDYAATACAIQNLMLAARARGLASFWRTPAVLPRPEATRLLDVPDGVRLIGIVHLGRPEGEFPPPSSERAAAAHTHWLP